MRRFAISRPRDHRNRVIAEADRAPERDCALVVHEHFDRDPHAAREDLRVQPLEDAPADAAAPPRRRARPTKSAFASLTCR
jgi:hypothetical protein